MSLIKKKFLKLDLKLLDQVDKDKFFTRLYKADLINYPVKKRFKSLEALYIALDKYKSSAKATSVKKKKKIFISSQIRKR